MLHRNAPCRALFLCALACTTVALGCGAGAAPTPKSPPPQPPATAAITTPAAPAAASESPPQKSKVKIKGLTGTLNTDDVNQTMEARHDALTACIQQSRRRLRWVNGSIHFAFKVDAEGAVTDVHPTTSDLGHHELETCITQVLAQTRFPAPDGDASAKFEWGLSVDPATPRVPDPAEPDFLEPVLRKHSDKIFKECEVRRRESFQITAYINRRGRVVSSGAVPRPAAAAEKTACVLEQFAKLKLPKLKQNAKVSFELK